MNIDDKLIVALDVHSLDKACDLVKVLNLKVKIFKIGLELFTACGREAIEMVHGFGAKVFLDLKFHDIPNTVANAVSEAVKMGVFMLNVHTLGGRDMLEAAVKAVNAESQKLNKQRPVLLGVTILTSIDRAALNSLGIAKSVRKEVIALAKLAKSSSMNGVVASCGEIEVIKSICGKDFIVVVPGIRPEASINDDQKRTAAPEEAIKKGADFIVVGRPVTKSENPLKAAENILAEISNYTGG
ncbi:MAG: orotidine-5'-phosphate decarboxylase [Candidatus Omnitrophota bacterium]